MKTTEAIEFLKSHDVTDAQGYNILIEDLYDVSGITPDSLNNPVPQALIQFFIHDLRTLNTQLKRGGQVFKDELDKAEANQPPTR